MRVAEGHEVIEAVFVEIPNGRVIIAPALPSRGAVLHRACPRSSDRGAIVPEASAECVEGKFSEVRPM